jgi:hypothetical protein
MPMNRVRPSQIPEDIWEQVFSQEISDRNLALMRAAPSELLGQLGQMTLSTTYEKEQAASAIFFGHPDIAPDVLFSCLKNIEPSWDGQIDLVDDILKVDALYPYIVTEHAHQLVAMLNEGNYDILFMLTMHNAQRVIEPIFDLVSPEKQLEIIKANDYEIFQRAGAAGNLPTMQYVVEKMTVLEPGNVNEMLTIEHNKVFDYADHCDYQEVIDYLLSFDIIFDYAKEDEEYQETYAELIAARARPLLVSQISMWQPAAAEIQDDNNVTNGYSSN